MTRLEKAKKQNRHMTEQEIIFKCPYELGITDDECPEIKCRDCWSMEL